MADTTSLHASLAALLPADILGSVANVTPIHMGLSGAGVYAVSAANGEFILRVQSAKADDLAWTQQLVVLRRAAEKGIAPAIVHVDETARAVVSRKVVGVPLPAALSDPSQRGPAISSIVSQLRVLHTIDPEGVQERDPVGYTRTLWEAQRTRPGYPAWVETVGELLDRIAAVLARDARRVVSHNDVNPGNVLWDGSRAWLVDWEAAGLSHPYYDLAALVTFLNLDTTSADGLLSAQEHAVLDDEARATFNALRQIVALAIGCTFLSMVPDLTSLNAASPGGVLSLADCYAEMRAGRLSLQTPQGQRAYGLALLKKGLEL